MKEYIERIKKAETLDELNAITESAANDESLTDAEYCDIYAEALRRAQSWQTQGIKIDTSSYKWFRNGKEPNGIDYYSFEVIYAGGKKAATYNFHGDYAEGLERIKEKFDGITEILVGV